MKKESLYGPDVRDRGWVPAPGYVLRRHRVLAAIDRPDALRPLVRFFEERARRAR